MRLIIILSIVLLLAGCRESGSSLFGSSSSSGDSGSSSGLSSGGSGDSSGSGSGSSGGPSSGSGQTMASIHQPEPSSMVLFGVGLAGLAAAIARKKRRK